MQLLAMQAQASAVNPTLVTIYYALFIPTLILASYYFFLALVGMFSHKIKYPMADDKMKFCIFVPGHNEESVIAATVENLAKITYDRSLFDIYFIADNCKDATAARIRETIERLEIPNFHTLERNVNDPKKRGKPHALRWAIDLLEETDSFYNKYDMFMILDADNFVDADILRHMNSQYLSYPEKKRPVMIQAYLDSKNKNTLIARGYFTAYRYTNGFFQLPRHKLHLVPGIGGTGFATSTAFLKGIGGYNCSSLVEDLEFETIATMHGETIAYNHNVRIYDEKPTGLVASAVQKTRWCQGHWYIFFKYAWRLFFKMFNPKEIKLAFKRLDNLVHLSSLFLMLLTMVVSIYTIVLQVLTWFHVPGTALFTAIPSWFTYITNSLYIITFLIYPISSLYDGSKKEKKMVLVELIPNLLSVIIAMLVYFYANVIGLFKCRNQSVWKKTVHKVTAMNADDIAHQAVELPAAEAEATETGSTDSKVEETV